MLMDSSGDAPFAKPILTAAFALPSYVQTTRKSAIHPGSSRAAARLRTRTLEPDIPKISPSCSPRSPRCRAGESHPSRTRKWPPARKMLLVLVHQPLPATGSSPSLRNTPPDILASCTGTRSRPAGNSSANGRRDNESPVAANTNSCAATWTAPAHSIGPRSRAGSQVLTLRPCW